MANNATLPQGSPVAGPVYIVDQFGAPISSFGGGAQYTDGATTPTHPTGTELVYDNAGVITAVSAANPLPVGATVTPSANQRVNAHAGDFVDGADVTQGTSTDANTVASVMGRLTKIRDLLNATLTVAGAVTTSGTVTEANSAAMKSDLDTIVTNTGHIPASPAQEGGNLATIATQTSGVATAANQTTGNTNTSAISTTTGATNDAAITNPASSGTLMAFLKGVVMLLAGVLFVKRSSVAVYTAAQTTIGTGNSGDLTIGPYTEISIDISTSAQAGTAPTIQFFWNRKGFDGIYYPLWQSAVLTTASNKISTSVGAGMAYNQSLAATGQLSWVVGGTSTPTWTFTPNIYGK